MAADWIKVDVTTPDKPEVFRMAERLGIDPDAVVGKLIRVWVWADQQTTNGNAPSVTRLLLDRATNVSGFADAMINVGWLVESDDGLTFPNFDRHNGKTAKTRALTVHRVRQHRNANVTKAALPRDRDIENRVTTGKTDSPKKRTTPDPSYARAFYDAFPPKRRAKPAKVEEAFAKAVASLRAGGMPEPETYLIRRATEYAASPTGRGEFVMGPVPWLNGRCWEDAPEAWGLSSVAIRPARATKSKAAMEAELIERERRSKLLATKEAS
jgi:hypothetical protein